MIENINTALLLIIIANVLVSIKGFSDAAFLDKFKFQVGKVLSGEKIRILTSGFLHVDWAHLGGAIGGFAITLLLNPSLFSTNTFMVGLLAVPIILLLLFGDKLKAL